MMAYKAAIFDYDGTLHDPESDQLYPGAIELVRELGSRGFKLSLVSRAQDVQGRRTAFDVLGLVPLFGHLDVVPSGVPKNLLEASRALGAEPSETLVVGDRVRSEIAEGNKLGMTTVWVRQGKFQDEIPRSDSEKPTFTVGSIAEVMPIATAS